MNEYFTYRLEEKTDYAETENLIREAFWDLYKPGCDEHFILHNMRFDTSYIRDLSFVCEVETGNTRKIVGAIYCTECNILDGIVGHTVMCIGPIGVMEEYQRKGAGLKLLSLALEGAAELGYCMAVLFGNPAYYRKSGFAEALAFGIHLTDGTDIPEFMCRPLDPVRSSSIKGNLQMNPVFIVDGKALEKYEKGFPAKEKHSREGQFFGSVTGGDQ